MDGDGEACGDGNIGNYRPSNNPVARSETWDRVEMLLACLLEGHRTMKMLEHKQLQARTAVHTKMRMSTVVMAQVRSMG